MEEEISDYHNTLFHKVDDNNVKALIKAKNIISNCHQNSSRLQHLLEIAIRSENLNDENSRRLKIEEISDKFSTSNIDKKSTSIKKKYAKKQLILKWTANRLKTAHKTLLKFSENSKCLVIALEKLGKHFTITKNANLINLKDRNGVEINLEHKKSTIFEVKKIEKQINFRNFLIFRK
ncbi:hypothetical protein MHBO_002442 [Bonamia ostreae]|uniref:Uncharacterized protein n=1 Tax=Bonamia ostreae TaxID=126728 RepID=A0ABV2AMA1_9EUKA